MTRLSYEDWNTLDTLLSRHGFGGYYDLIECLKIVAGDLGISCAGLDLEGPDNKISLPQMIQYLQDWSHILTHTEGFLDIAKKAGSEVIKK